jgi:hypothetical protein
VAIQQAELRLPPPPDSDESEQERELRLHAVLLRRMEDAAAEVGRERICYALHLSEATLSKQLREIEEKRPSYRLMAYLIKHEKSGRLARWLMSDYAGYLPPQRPDRISPEEFTRLIAAMALGGQFGASERQEVLALYERVQRPKGET